LRSTHRLGSGGPTGEVGPGDIVIIYGIGGIGINAVQGACTAGARSVIAVDLWRISVRQRSKLGATDAFATAEEAHDFTMALTNAPALNTSIITVGNLESDVVTAAFDVLAKAGILVVVSLSAAMTSTFTSRDFSS